MKAQLKIKDKKKKILKNLALPKYGTGIFPGNEKKIFNGLLGSENL